MQEFLFLFSGLLSGVIVTYLFSKNKYENKIKKLELQLLNETELKIKAETQFKVWKESVDKAQMLNKEIFESIASDVLRNNSQAFFQHSQQFFEKYISKTSDDYQQRKLAIDEMLKPLKEALLKNENLFKETQVSNSNLFGSFKTYLDELQKSQKSLEKETNALVTALKSPKVRGRWGEIGLKRIVEFSGMTAYCDFQEQFNMNTDDGRLRPDMLVNLPDNKKIVIDSKIPLNAYLDAIETESEENRKQKLTDHLRAVQNHVKQLSSKAYWSQFENSVDFVVLYIEVEPAFGAALIQDSGLVAEAIQNRIVFATPTTLITLLQTVGYSWKQHKATENAIEILNQSRELYERLATFTDYIQKMGVNIQNIVKIFNQAVGSWESRVMPAIKKIENLGVNSTKKNIDSLTDIELSTRALKE